jgi:carbonic anhydrase
LIAYQAYAAAGVYDYNQNGMDWPDICASGLEQSPINFDRRMEVLRNDLTIDVFGWDASPSKIALPEGKKNERTN